VARCGDAGGFPCEELVLNEAAPAAAGVFMFEGSGGTGGGATGLPSSVIYHICITLLEMTLAHIVMCPDFKMSFTQ